jgi:iron(III) transport system permease protein
VRQTRPARPTRHAVPSRLTALLMFSLIAAQLILPVLGLILPAFSGGQFERAWNEVLRTFWNTGMYSAGAGATATAFGFVLAFCSARSERLRRVSLAASLAFLSLPPSLAALGVIAISGGAPEWTDPVLRSRFTVSLTLGMRFFPVSALVALRAWSSLPATWALAAGVHGISAWRYLWKVLLPFFAPSLLMSFVIATLLAGGDIVTTLLLHPPGASSLPLSIFTIMANAPESIVASLCLLYVAVAVVLLGSLWWLAERAWK